MNKRITRIVISIRNYFLDKLDGYVMKLVVLIRTSKIPFFLVLCGIKSTSELQ